MLRKSATLTAVTVGAAMLATTATALSTRYGTPATLVGHLVQTVPGLWEANWRVRVGEDVHDWRAEGDLFALLLEEGIDTLADALARRFADPASNSCRG